MNAIQEQLRALIIRTLRLEDANAEELGAETPLFGEGLGLDSIDALELVVALEKEFGIKIGDDEVGPEVFKNLTTLGAFIESKRKGTP
jgi:acyl carrier protein